MTAQNIQNESKEVEYNGKEPLKGKREKFAQLIATGTKNQTEAHKTAGYKEWKGSGRYAWVLANNPLIMARIKYLRAELAEKMDISRDSQVKEYIGIRDRAVVAGDLRAEIAANQSIDKLCGLIIDKVQTERTEAQVARTAVEQRLDKRVAQILLAEHLAAERGSEAVTEVILDDV